MIHIPPDVDHCVLRCGNYWLTLTNLRKIFWPALRKTKRDLLLYYASLARVIVPHVKDRAMVLKRYPNGIEGKFFFLARTPPYRPDWLETCAIKHASGALTDLPIVQNAAALLWIVNLGCIDLNPWSSRWADMYSPDFLHFDLDPVPPAGFAEVRRVALLLRDYIQERKVDCYPKTTGARGIHVSIPIYPQPEHKEVWTIARNIAHALAKKFPAIITAEYRITLRPPGRVMIDYNQNAWGRTLASVYSVRAKPEATVSAPVTWGELEAGISTSDLTMDTVPPRVEKLGDLFQPVLRTRNRCKLESLAS
jgi:bifunctional non-homologous end joining protein LigD